MAYHAMGQADVGSNKEWHLTYFYSPGCSECFFAEMNLDLLPKAYSQLKIEKINIYEDKNQELKEAYDITYGVPPEERGYTPVVFIGDYYFGGLKGIEFDLPGLLKEYSTGELQYRPRVVKIQEVAKEGIVQRFKSFKIGGILLAGLIDGINPCAFAILVFFISYLLVSTRKRKDIPIVGSFFTLGVFITNLSLGVVLFEGVSRLSFISNLYKLIYPLTGALSIVLTIYSFRDYKKARSRDYQKITLQLPKGIKKITHEIIRRQVRMKYLPVVALGTGILISLFEFLCTGQIYLPTIIYIGGISQFRTRALSYLLLYNLAFILPLIIVFCAAYSGVRALQLSGLLNKWLASIKLITGILFLGFAVYMVGMTLSYYF